MPRLTLLVALLAAAATLTLCLGSAPGAAGAAVPALPPAAGALDGALDAPAPFAPVQNGRLERRQKAKKTTAKKRTTTKRKKTTTKRRKSTTKRRVVTTKKGAAVRQTSKALRAVITTKKGLAATTPRPTSTTTTLTTSTTSQTTSTTSQTSTTTSQTTSTTSQTTSTATPTPMDHAEIGITSYEEFDLRFPGLGNEVSLEVGRGFSVWLRYFYANGTEYGISWNEPETVILNQTNRTVIRNLYQDQSRLYSARAQSVGTALIYGEFRGSSASVTVRTVLPLIAFCNVTARRDGNGFPNVNVPQVPAGSTPSFEFACFRSDGSEVKTANVTWLSNRPDLVNITGTSYTQYSPNTGSVGYSRCSMQLGQATIIATDWGLQQTASVAVTVVPVQVNLQCSVSITGSSNLDRSEWGALDNVCFELICKNAADGSEILREPAGGDQVIFTSNNSAVVVPNARCKWFDAPGPVEISASFNGQQQAFVGTFSFTPDSVNVGPRPALHSCWLRAGEFDQYGYLRSEDDTFVLDPDRPARPLVILLGCYRDVYSGPLYLRAWDSNGLVSWNVIGYPDGPAGPTDCDGYDGYSCQMKLVPRTRANFTVEATVDGFTTNVTVAVV